MAKKDAAKKQSPSGKEGRKEKKFIKETAEALIVAFVLAILIKAFVIQAFKIPSGSMEDTLLIGDHLLVTKFSYGMQAPRPAWIKVLGVWMPFFETQLKPVWGGIKRWDVIVFRFPGDRTKDYIKRVAALPGDTIEVKNKRIYINSIEEEDPYGVFKDSPGPPGNPLGERVGWIPRGGDDFGPYTVEKGHVFAMGDNRDRSSDSRVWGPVPINDIKGKALIIYFSWDHENKNVRFSRFAHIVR